MRDPGSTPCAGPIAFCDATHNAALPPGTSAKFMLAVETDWVDALRGTSERSTPALGALRELILGGLRLALHRRTDVSEAHLQDFTQEALMHILARLDQFEGRSKFTTWAHAIAINTAFAELRRKRWQDTSLAALAAEGRQLAEPGVLPDEQLGADDERARVLAALRRGISEKLTDRQRTAILGQLRDVPVDQLVGLLRTNRGAFYKLNHDARQTLKAHLIAEGIAPESIRSAFAT